MKMPKNILILILFTHLCNKSNSQEFPIATFMESCFKIVGYKGGEISKTGSGFIVKSYIQNDGFSHLCISNAHVMEDLDSAELIFSDYSSFKVNSFIHSNHKLDITFFKFISKQNRKGVFLIDNLIKKYENDLGSEIITISSPKGLTNSISSGIISGIRKNKGETLLQMTAPISGGSSGGLVIKRNGGPIGVIVSQLSEGQNINFAIPFNIAIEELISKELATKDLILINSKSYLLPDMEDYFTNNDKTLNDIWKSVNNENEFYFKVSKIENEDLTQRLLFLKVEACIQKENWLEAFNTIFYSWGKYRSSIELLQLYTSMSNFAYELNTKKSFKISSLISLAKNDEILLSSYYFINGCLSVITDDEQGIFSNFLEADRYISDFKKETLDIKDINSLAKDLISDCMVTITYQRLGISYTKLNNYNKAASFFEKALNYHSEIPSKLYFLHLAIYSYLLAKNDAKACTLFTIHNKILREEGDIKKIKYYQTFCN